MLRFIKYIIRLVLNLLLLLKLNMFNIFNCWKLFHHRLSYRRIIQFKFGLLFISWFFLVFLRWHIFCGELFKSFECSLRLIVLQIFLFFLLFFYFHWLFLYVFLHKSIVINFFSFSDSKILFRRFILLYFFLWFTSSFFCVLLLMSPLFLFAIGGHSFVNDSLRGRWRRSNIC